jgi:hypothetical protein
MTGMTVISEDLQELMDLLDPKPEQTEKTTTTHCKGCGTELPPKTYKGRDRIWCSQRCRRLHYARKCIDCGGPCNVDGRTTHPNVRCAACHLQHHHDTRKWTKETIIQAIQTWANTHNGEPPTAPTWNTTETRKRTGQPRSSDYPSPSTVITEYGSWNNAIQAAGYTPLGIGKSPHQRNNPHANPQTQNPA